MAKRDREAVKQGLSQILGEPEAGDLLGNVIQNDRQRAGRLVPSTTTEESAESLDEEGVTETDDIMTSHTATGQYDNRTNTQADIIVGLQSDNRTNKQTDKHTSPMTMGQADTLSSRTEVAPKREGKRKPDRSTDALLEKRVAEAKSMAESGTTTVTLRIPRELNDWLDEYVHRAWPERVRKQELVIEALKLLFARRGRPGEPVLQTALLPEEPR